MKSRQLTVLLLILLGLLGIYFFQGMRGDKALEQSSAKVELKPQVDSGMINRIEIVEPAGALALEKQGEGWQIAEATEATGSAVSTTMMDDLLGILNGVPVELVSQNVDRQQELGVSNEQAIQLRFLNGEQAQYVLLVSPMNKQIFRQMDKENVYNWGASYSRLIDTDVNYWLAPTPMPTQEATDSGEVVE